MLFPDPGCTGTHRPWRGGGKRSPHWITLSPWSLRSPEHGFMSFLLGGDWGHTNSVMVLVIWLCTQIETMRLFQSQTERHFIPGTKPISCLINYLQLKLIKSSEYHKRGKETKKKILSCMHMTQLLPADSCSGKQMEPLFPDIVRNNNSIVLNFKVAKQSKYVPTVMPVKTELQPLSADYCLTRTLFFPLPFLPPSNTHRNMDPLHSVVTLFYFFPKAFIITL